MIFCAHQLKKWYDGYLFDETEIYDILVRRIVRMKKILTKRIGKPEEIEVQRKTFIEKAVNRNIIEKRAAEKKAAKAAEENTDK